ncbi:MAG TPA: hypothetical protein VE134_02970 [Methanomicrobiales archaeon]|nr:hypothetical protein [Methanomicrobiales archaeon]
MRRYALALSLTPFLISPGLAAVEATTPGNLQMQDYFTIFLGVILYINIFLVVLYKMFKTTRERKSQFAVVNIFGVFFAFLLISAGYIQIIYSALVITSIVTDLPMFAWAYYLTAYYFPSVAVGLLILGACGVTSLLLGLYVLMMLRGNPFIDLHGMPQHSGLAAEVLIGGDEEPVNPNITYRVRYRDSDDPAIDVKVILQQREGSRIYEKYTDFNGEVAFHKIDGFASDYYAFVEGDESRSKYRVIRSQVSAEPET